jgi:4-diphosphocytidyl-2-C-methyl-D-erythritol kinase
MPTAVRSHAKINLGLGIGAPRPDGFHALVTVYQTLALHDIVTVSARPAAESRIRLTSNDARVPTDGRNTAWKMVSLALEGLGVAAEVEIHIEKRLPVQGGLGAGSANAVAALVGLETELGVWAEGRALPPFGQRTSEEWDTGNQNRALPPFGQKASKGWGTGGWWPARRLEIAAQVGSDVPLFLIGGTVLGLDRGQDVYPLPDFEPVWCAVALPETGVSTPQAFRDWDALCAAEGLTAEASAGKLNELSRAYASAFARGQTIGSSGVVSKRNECGRDDLAGPLESALVRTGITSWMENDFERVVFAQRPSLREIKRILLGTGTPEAALYASLSGSGSALFGLYQTRGDAEAARARLQAAGVQSELTQTLPRTRYWSEMLS